MPFTAAFHTYTASDTVTSTNLNGNINQIITQGNAIDNTYVNPLTGFYASQIIPTSGPQGTFGGSQPYTFPVELDFTGTTVTAGAVAIGGDAGATKGMLLNVPTGSTNGFRFQVNGSTVFQVPNTGIISTVGNANIGGVLQASPTINATTVLGPVAPAYGSGGAAVASTWHYCIGVTGSIAASGTATINLT